MPVNDLIQLRKGTTGEWSGVNPILSSGEPGYDITTRILKIGDGTSNWNSLSGIVSSDVPYESTDIVDFNSAVSGLLPATYDAAVQWTPYHTVADGTRYLVNDLVYQSGRLYKANYENESIPVTDALYWTDVGAGYRLNIDGRDISNIPYPVQNIVAGTGIVVDTSGTSFTISSIPSNTSVSGALEANSLTTTVFNKTNNTIPKFSVVYIDGGQGDQPTIQLSLASTEMASSKSYGITAENISSMSTGKVIVYGALSGLNTDQFNPSAPQGDVNGVTLWLSPTISGGVTTTKPYAPYHAVAVGTIVRTHQNEGIVEVRIQNGFELQELHNVATTGALGGQFLQYNSSSSLWVPSSSGYFTALGVSGTNNPNLLFIDTLNNTINIGTGVSTGSKLYLVTDSSTEYTNILASGGPGYENSLVRISNTNNSGVNSLAGLFLSTTRQSSNVAQGAIVACVSTNMSTYSPNIVFASRTGASSYAEYMRIRHNGNVGIGTNSPSYLLDVAGTGNFSSNLLVNGTGVSLSGHTHGYADIADFNTGVSGLLPVKNIIAGSNISISSNNGAFTINASISGSGGASDTLYIGNGSSTAITYPSTSPLNIVGSGGVTIDYNDSTNTVLISSPTAVKGYEVVSSNKTLFDINQNYASGNLDVYFNGFKLLINDDYTANGGSSFTLSNAATSGDIVEWLGSSTSSSAYASAYHTHSSNDIIFASGTPSTSSASGTTGQMLWDNNYIYLCVSPNTWKRSSLNSW